MSLIINHVVRTLLIGRKKFCPLLWRDFFLHFFGQTVMNENPLQNCSFSEKKACDTRISII